MPENPESTNRNEKPSIHHVPPKSSGCRNIFELPKPPHEHRAYHLIFGNPGPKNLDEALDVLESIWPDFVRGKTDTKFARAFGILFGETRDPDVISRKLKKEWWTRPE